jgi:hypothetical protein
MKKYKLISLTDSEWKRLSALAKKELNIHISTDEEKYLNLPKFANSKKMIRFINFRKLVNVISSNQLKLLFTLVLEKYGINAIYDRNTNTLEFNQSINTEEIPIKELQEEPIELQQ